MADAINLSDVLSANKAVSVKIDAAASQELDVNSAIQSTLENRKNNSLALANAEEVLSDNANRVTQQREAAVTNVLNEFYANPTAAGNKLKEYNDQIIAARDAQVEAKKSIDAKNSVSFLDNPLGYIVAQHTINEDISKYNAAAADEDNAYSAAAHIEANTNAAAKNAALTISTVTDSTIAADRIKAGYKAMQDASSAQLDALSQNLHHIQTVVNWSKEQAKLAGDSLQQVNQQKQLNVSMAHLALAKENAAFNRELKQEKAEAQEFEGKLLARGYLAMTGQNMPEQLMKEAMTPMGRANPKVKAWFDSGNSSFAFDSTGATSIISNSAADTLKYTGQGYVTRMTQGAAQSVRQLNKWQVEFANPAKQNELKIDPKDKNAIDAAFNKFVATKLSTESMNVRADSILAPLPIADWAKSGVDVSKYPVYTKVLKPLVDAGAKLDDPKIAIAATVKAVKDGTLSYTDAVELTSIYAQSKQLAITSRNLMGLGMASTSTPEATLQSYVTSSQLGTFNHTDAKEFGRRLGISMLPMSKPNAGELSIY